MSYQPSSYQPSSRPQLAPLEIHHNQSNSNSPPSTYGYTTPMAKSPSNGTGGYSSANRPRPNLGIVTGASEAFPQRAARKSSLPQLPQSSPFLVPDGAMSAQLGATGSGGVPAPRSFGSLSPSPSGGLSSPNSDGNLLSPPLTPGSQAKKANPLIDLIDTETAYVADLGSIIKVTSILRSSRDPTTWDRVANRLGPADDGQVDDVGVGHTDNPFTLLLQRVAAAWSRHNFPPPELDSMFRAIEAVYRINKSLLAVSQTPRSLSAPRTVADPP